MLEYLEAAIDRNPLVAGADVTVLSAIQQIRDHLSQGVSTCVVIVADGGQVLGSLTEQDVIELVSQQQPIDQITLGQFLQQKLSPSASLTILESDLSNINTAIAHFEQQRIRSLPIVNTQNQLVGLLPYEVIKCLKNGVDNQVTTKLLIRQQQILERITTDEPLVDVLHDLLQTSDRSHQDLQQLNQELENRVLSRTQELLEREQFLQTVLDTFPLAVFWKDVNSVYLGCNQHFLRDAGLQSIEEIIGKTDYQMPWGATEADLYRAGDRNTIVTQIAKLGIVESLHNADGQMIWLETNKLPLRNLQGEVVGIMGTYQDISDRKATELEQQRQLAILDNTSDLIGTCAPDGTIFYINQAWRNVLQQDDGKLATRIEITEQHPAWALDLVQQEGIPAAIEYGSWQGETAIINGKEQEIPVSQVIIAHKSKNGELEYISTIMRDITVQKQTEQELVLNQHHLTALLDNLPHLAWIKDAQSRFIAVNEPLAQAFGMQTEELVGKNDYDIVPADLAQAYRDDDFQVLQSGQRQVVEERIVLANGSMRWLETTKTPFRDDRQVIAGTVGIAADITDRKMMELALKDSERRYASLAAAAPVGIFRFDTPQHCIYVNERWSELTGRSMESALGYGWMDGLYPGDGEEIIAEWAEFYEQNSPDSPIIHRGEGRHLLPDGTTVWVDIQVAKEFDADDNIVSYVGTLTDITDGKVAELALQESQAQFRRLTENVPGMIYRYVLHPDGRDCFTYVSPQICELYEVAAEQAIQDPAVLWAQIHPDDMPILQAKVLESAANLTPFVLEHRLETPSGLKFAKAIAQPERQQDGSIFWDGIVIDITDLKLTELALQESQAQFRRMTENVPGMIYRYIVYPDGRDRVTYVSSQSREIFELEPEAVLADAKQLWGRIHPDDLARIGEAVQHSAATLTPFASEYRLNLPQGGLRWVHNHSHTEKLEDGTVVWDGLVLDSTDRKNAAIALQDLSNRLEFALKGANIGIWEWQKIDGRLQWDDRMCTLYGILPAEFSGEYADWLDRIHPDDRELVQQTEQLAHQAANESHVEFRIIHPDGAIRFIDSYAFNQRNDQGEIQKTIGLNIDITDRRLAAAQLQRSNEQLARATRLKDEFLANMSHELRTPLNAILGMTEALQEEVFGNLNERQHKSLQTVEKSSNHLLALINDILDVAKIEAGQIKLNCQLTNITTLCQSSLAFIKQQAYSKNIALVVSISQILPNISIDERRIRQALINLLSNAVKFTPNGGKITLQVQKVSIKSSDETVTNLVAINDSLEINIIDTGIGIAADQIERLFQPFVQVESSLNRNYDGTGLGLALVKRLVELHGGHVRLTSELGTGSCFTISLPITKTGEISIVPEPLIPINLEAIENDGKDAPVILLAEDNEASVSTFVSYLSLKGYQMIVADNGQMAIDLAQQNNPDLILMDVQMPGMDGLEAIWHIRQQPKFSDTPIIALTALAMPGDRERCLAAGASDYLSKPVKLKDLAHQINNYLKPSIL